MNDTQYNAKKDKGQHIQVFLRVRPMNDAELSGKSAIVVDVPSNKEVIIREKAHDTLSKKFTFDKVFGPKSKQIEVYNAIVSPLLEEILAGYNCTVFAYGQTGTGKTFTMEGIGSDPTLNWQTDTTAGIIPRVLSHLFDELRLLEVQEYAVRVSFLELYNEEIFDLLSPSVDTSKIRLYEDSTKKGAVIIHGLEEITVHNKNEIYKILEKGSEKRQTAATLMNAHSSRSHTVFSITIHIKENTVDGEELLKTGKLNLVDLAGSENVGRSGAVDKRAREAGNINQSLLTLGRVITALVERAPHVPYRESKLTRLLQESLGGRTKTSIIATISPASINLEETLSTLDYAHRAKNITNRPEINQKLSKKALLQEYTEEIERLKRELAATRERDGVYLAYDSYNQMQSLMEYQSREIEEKNNYIMELQEAIQNKEQITNELSSKHSELENELLNAKNELETATHDLKSTMTFMEIVEHERDEQKHLVEKHVSTESARLSQAQTLLNVAETATLDVYKLHDKIFRKKEVEQKNNYMGEKFGCEITTQIQDIESTVDTYARDLTQFCISLRSEVDERATARGASMDRAIQQISVDLLNSEKFAIEKLTGNINNLHTKYQHWFEQKIRDATDMSERERDALNELSNKLAPEIKRLIENEFVNNLRILNMDISRQFDNLLSSAKNSIKSICDYRLEQRNRLYADVAEVIQIVENLEERQSKIMERRRNFVKTMAGVQSYLNNLSEETEISHSTLCNTLSHVKGVCKNANQKILNIYNTTTEKEQSFQQKMERDLQALQTNIADETEKCRMVTEEAVLQVNTLMNELQGDIRKTCDRLTDYESTEEHNKEEIRQKIREDNSAIITSMNGMYTMLDKECNDYKNRIENHKIASLNASTKISETLNIESTNATNLTNKISGELCTLRTQVNDLFTKDLQRDVSTGTTPSKRNFQYPQELTATSPHEKILQSFRETQKIVDAFKDGADQ